MEVFNPFRDIAEREKELLLASTGLMLLNPVPGMILIAVRLAPPRLEHAGDLPARPNHSARFELVIWAAPLLIIICLGRDDPGRPHLLDPIAASTA